ncbi:MAG: UDP-glucuronic acid decarboxylase family protein [Gammaproteobacteria bacterium]|nr:UDP-glucuronic acid decarboxylase family protein [Gammaproteobacteria bacterium]
MATAKTRRILVTGGAGFIGSHLCRRLVDQKQYVICLDNLSTGSIENVACLLEAPNFEFIQHDVTLPIQAEVDEIYNLACPASPLHYQREPVETLRTSVVGTMNVLELALRTGARVLHASTSEIYGDPEQHPQPESYSGNVNPIGVRACYNEGKRCAETLCFDYRRRHGLKPRIARIFNTYGPNMRIDDGRVISNFIVQALCSEPITLYGDGQQSRSFCFVDDMIDALTCMMSLSCDIVEPVNLGNPTEISMADLAQRVIQLTDSDIGTRHESAPPDDPRRRRPCIDRARSVLGWEPATDLDQGLTVTIDYFRDLLRCGRMDAERTTDVAAGTSPASGMLRYD